MRRFKNSILDCNFDLKQQTAMDRAVLPASQYEVCLTVFTVVKELPADARMAIIIMPPPGHGYRLLYRPGRFFYRQHRGESAERDELFRTNGDPGTRMNNGNERTGYYFYALNEQM